MSSINAITVDKLNRIIGTPRAPSIVDVRSEAQFAADPRLIPGSVRRSAVAISEWPQATAGRAFVVLCEDGSELSPGVAAWLRNAGRPAEVLEGGFRAWRDSLHPTLLTGKLPRRDAQDRTVWVTRERPKIDRIACPWLIRRFVDASAVFLFVAPAQVASVADRFEATPFDIEETFWSHRGDQCTFDVFLTELGLDTAPLRHLAKIVRGADTARPELAPETHGLLAISLGLSRMYADDLEQMEAGFLIYDALYRWSRDARTETHDWVPTQRRGNAPSGRAK